MLYRQENEEGRRNILRPSDREPGLSGAKLLGCSLSGSLLGTRFGLDKRSNDKGEDQPGHERSNDTTDGVLHRRVGRCHAIKLHLDICLGHTLALQSRSG